MYLKSCVSILSVAVLGPQAANPNTAMSTIMRIPSRKLRLPNIFSTPFLNHLVKVVAMLYDTEDNDHGGRLIPRSMDE
jgi:hypothetical protein